MKIALIGYGKMGKAIEEMLKPKHEVVLIATSYNIETIDKNLLSKADVAIEFTQPNAVFDNIKLCFENKVPIVVGTTGWNSKKEEIHAMCKKYDGAMIYASNFSIGVNVLFQANQFISKLMSKLNYDCFIEEIHHTEKKDIPSGTAISIAEGIIQENNRWRKWVSQQKYNEEELLILSQRKEQVPGTHTITYTSNYDIISLSHEAKNRQGFAEGAVWAAEWIAGKKGMFSLQEVIFKTNNDTI